MQGPSWVALVFIGHPSENPGWFREIGVDLVFSSMIMEDLGKSISVSQIETECHAGFASPQQKELYDLFEGSRRSSKEIMIVIPSTMISSDGSGMRGCASNEPGKPLVLLSGKHAEQWTLPHELGHIFVEGAGVGTWHSTDKKI